MTESPTRRKTSQQKYPRNDKGGRISGYKLYHSTRTTTNMLKDVKENMNKIEDINTTNTTLRAGKNKK